MNHERLLQKLSSVLAEDPWYHCGGCADFAVAASVVLDYVGVENSWMVLGDAIQEFDEILCVEYMHAYLYIPKQDCALDHRTLGDIAASFWGNIYADVADSITDLHIMCKRFKSFSLDKMYELSLKLFELCIGTPPAQFELFAKETFDFYKKELDWI